MQEQQHKDTLTHTERKQTYLWCQNPRIRMPLGASDVKAKACMLFKVLTFERFLYPAWPRTCMLPRPIVVFFITFGPKAYTSARTLSALRCFKSPSFCLGCVVKHDVACGHLSSLTFSFGKTLVSGLEPVFGGPGAQGSGVDEELTKDPKTPSLLGTKPAEKQRQSLRKMGRSTE